MTEAGLYQQLRNHLHYLRLEAAAEALQLETAGKEKLNTASSGALPRPMRIATTSASWKLGQRPNTSSSALAFRIAITAQAYRS